MAVLVEERVDRLEALLGQFIVSTNAMMIRSERVQEEFKQEMKAFKDEMKDFKDEMKVFKNEMLDFKDEMKVFKNEMVDFKDEMKDFKDEMKDFKDETESDRRRMNKQWGELANKMGTLVEDIVVPNIPRIAEEYFHINTLDLFAVRVRKRKTTDTSVVREFDIVAASEKYVLVNETKSTPKIDYIHEFIEMLPQFKEFFPEYQNRIVLPIFSSLYLPEEIVQYLSKHHIYALGMADETMDVLNFTQIPLAN